MTNREESSAPIECNHCGNFAPMKIVGKVTDAKIEHEDEELGHLLESGTTFEVLKCPSCPEVTIRCYHWHDMMDETAPLIYSTIFPSHKKIPIGLPPNIEKALIAAFRIQGVDANAFGVLIGRVIEMVCEELGAEGKYLAAKLQDLATKGEIPSKLAEVATKLRKLRNVGAHPGLGELSNSDVPIVEDLCRALLDYVYTAPHLLQRADEALDRAGTSSADAS